MAAVLLNIKYNNVEKVVFYTPALESVLLANQAINFFTSDSVSTGNVTVSADITYFDFVLGLKTQLDNIYIPVELAVLGKSYTTALLLILSSFLTQQQITCFTEIQENCVESLSTLVPGHTWVERECSEMQQIYFTGLRDARRLLTDYTVRGELLDNFTNYNLTVQQVLFKRDVTLTSCNRVF